jgi:outer membrane protein TolC
LLGRFPHPVDRDAAGFFGSLPRQIAAGVPSQMLANRPDIREAELQVQASQFDLKAAKAAFYPQFTITGTLGFQAFNTELLFTAPESLAYSAMGGLVTPIINRQAFKAHFKAVRANQLSAMYQYQKTILNAYVEVANELANIRNLAAFSASKREQRDMLTRAVDTSEELYKRGRASYLEVLMAQQNALQAGLELIQAIKQQRIAQVNIYRALGGGWK